MTQAIRFYSIDPRTGAEDTEYGHAWKTDEGLEYENDIVRDIMANTVGRYGQDKAFTWFSDWGNGYSCSHLVEDGDASRADLEDEGLDDEAVRAMALGGDEFEAYWTRGKGLKRWSLNPHPWRKLRRLLRKHPGIHDPEGLASHYFHVVFGIWPGERKGQNPVGPG